MKKLILLVVVFVLVGALLALLFSQTPGEPGGSGSPEAATPGTPGATPDNAREKAKNAREKEAEARPALSISGIVTSGGQPVAGAVVDAFALPENAAPPDEDRAARETLTRSFGREAADRMVGQGRKLRAAMESRDTARLTEVMQDGMSLGMELMGEDGGIDVLVALMKPNLNLAGDDAAGRCGSAATGADGAFRIEGLAAGQVELRVRAARHVVARRRVAAGDAGVAVALDRGVRVFGVVKAAGRALAGATIRVKDAQVVSGDGGKFDLDAARPGRETLLVSAPGCVTQGRSLALRLDAPDKEIEIDLDLAGSAAGHVSSLTGGPIAGARVAISPSPNFFMDMMGMGGGGGRFDVPPAAAVTDAGGAFEMTGIPAGPTKFRVEADGYLGTNVSVTVKPGVVAPVEALLVRESVLAGTVRDEKGAAVAGAKVRVAVPSRDAMTGMMAAMMGSAFRSVLAGPDGTFLVHGLAAGKREVRVEAEGFLSLKDTIEIPAESAATHDFVLTPGMKLEGTVSGPDGKPFAGARIYAAGKPDAASMNPMAAMMGGGKKDAVAESGADGRFTADGLPPGPYEVTASADGYLDGVVKDVAPGRTDVALTLGAAATIRGRVYSSSGMSPLAGATITRRSAGGGNRGGRGGRGGRNPMAAMFGAGGGDSVESDKEGVFEMKGVEAGDYEISGSLRGFATSEPVKVTAIAGQSFEGVEILLPAGVAVSGRVVEAAGGAPIADAVVWSAATDNPFAGFSMGDAAGGEPEAPGSAISARTGADGRFTLEGLVPGKVTLEVRAAGRAPATLAGAAAPSSEIVVELSAGGTVEGRVTGSDTGPVAGAQIMLMRGMMGGGMRQARSNATGEYRFEHVVAGSWQIMMMDPANPMMPSGMAPLTVTEGGVTRHDFAKKTGGKPMGGGVSKDGKPLANVPVMLMGGPSGLKMTSTDDTGRFAFESLDPGDYTVLVQSTFMGGGSTSRKVTVGADGKVEDVQLELSSARIEGDVVDVETGKGIAGAQVALTTPAGSVSDASDALGTFRGQAITDERGHFVVRDVQQATFTLKASASGYPPVSVERVSAGSKDVRVEMRLGIELVVNVVGPDDRPVANASVNTLDASGNPVLVFDQTMSQFTRAEGIVRLRLVPGRYTISVSASNLLPARVEADANQGSVTVRLETGATLELAVTGADGVTPLARARVAVYDAAGNEVRRGFSMESFTGGSDRTGTDGRWVRPGLPAGDVKVVVTDPDTGASATVTTTLEMNSVRQIPIVVK